MIVLTIANCPPSLRGDLTKWLFEVSVGVYVGRVSARVRDELWVRVRKAAKNGRATLVWSSNSEQGLDFRVHNSDWEPIDFDGLKLMMHPNLTRLKQTEHRVVPSNASRYALARRKAASGRKKASATSGYVVVDVAATGLAPERDEIIELAALRVRGGEVVDRIHALVRSVKELPPTVEQLTGISMQMLYADGRPLADVFPEFIQFIGEDFIVSHNTRFNLNFLNAACRRLGLNILSNQTKDTFEMSKKQLYQLKNHRLVDVAEHLGVQVAAQRRALADCHTAYEIYEKLTEGK